MKTAGASELPATPGLFGKSPEEWAADPDGALLCLLLEEESAKREGARAFKASSAKTLLSVWRSAREAAKAAGLPPPGPLAPGTAEAIARLLPGKAGHRAKAALLLARAEAALGAPRRRPAPVGGEPEAPPKFLSEAEAEALAAACPDFPPSDPAPAYAAAFLGAGLKVSEALALSVNCVGPKPRPGASVNCAPPAFLQVAGPMRRAAPLPAWAGAALAARAEHLRSSGADEDSPLFRGPTGAAQAPSSAFRAVRRLAEAAGLPPGPRLCPQTLRNSRAAQLFASGVPDAEAGALLGMAEVRSVERLRAAWELAIGLRPGRTRTAGAPAQGQEPGK